MTGRVVVVGLGPAGPDLVTRGTLDALDGADRVFLRTSRHPAAAVAPTATSFDHVYDEEDSLDAVYPRIVDEVVDAALDIDAGASIVYAVPGSPVVAERTVAMLIADARVAVEVLPALSFVDLTWNRLAVDPIVEGVQLVDGRSFAQSAAGSEGPLLIAQCDNTFTLSDIKLAVDDPGDVKVTVLQRLGLPDEQIFDVAWDDLDRLVEPDHLTSLYVPQLAAPVAAAIMRFTELVTTLRQECPWDREQTHKSLTRHLIEETYEVLDAIEHLDSENGDGYDLLEEELGDLFFQVVFHATLATEAGAFTLADVATGIHDKLRLRHPHVFADVQAEDAAAVMSNWEQIKKVEKGRESVMDGIPPSLPSLLLALKVQKKAANAGMDFASTGEAYAKVIEELDEVRDDPTEGEVGDLLFAVTTVAQRLGVDPENALRSASTRFSDRFRVVEQLASARGIDLRGADDAAVDALWNEAKRQLSRG